MKLLKHEEYLKGHPTFLKLQALIAASLPDGVALINIMEVAPFQLIKDNFKAAFAYSLRYTDKLDWQRYLAQYADVREANIDGCLHFLKHGLFEGRQLFSSHAAEEKYQPNVSVVLINYNNEIYLGKAIESILNQTLKNIELVIVDDASTDNSHAIIQSYVKSDKRIKYIQHKSNQSQHMARKHGVAAATGKYIMFLDSDDYYNHNACEVAYAMVKDGYDIACYNFNIIPAQGLDEAAASLFKESHTVKEQKIYLNRDILRSSFFYYRINPLLWNKIYKSSICKQAFAEMEDGYFPNGQDIFAFIACATYATSYIENKDALYNYRMGNGVSFTDSTSQKLQYSFHRGSILYPLKKFCENHGLINVYKNILSDFCKRNLAVLLELIPRGLVNSYFDKMVEDYGLQYVMCKLIDVYFENWYPIAHIFQHYQITPSPDIKKIGIFYYRLSIGGVETVISSLCDILREKGYKVVIFIEERSENDLKFDDDIEIIYLKSSRITSENMKNHVYDLYLALQTIKIDVMIYNYTWSWCLLWDSIVLHTLNIPIIVYHHGDFTYDFIDFGKKFNYRIQNEIFKCCDKVLCLSTFSELFFRMHGVDAEYIPNPVKIPIPIVAKKYAGPNILFLARLGDRNKQIREALLVLKEVLKTVPDVYMYFVGDFDSHEQTIQFYKVAQELGVRQRLALTGWTHHPQEYMKKCSILLSTSHWESFGMSLAEAQTFGLPCVAYYVPTMVVDENEGIISVPPNDYKEAAKEIIHLLTDISYWQSISAKASVSQKQFSFEKFSKNFIYFLETFQESSTYRTYSRHDYEVVIKSIAHFATVGPRQTKL